MDEMLAFAEQAGREYEAELSGKTPEPSPDDRETGETVRTLRGTFYVTDMSREQMEAAGYGFHHQSDDGKYLIMGNGSRAFAIRNEEAQEHAAPEKMTVLVVEPRKEPYLKEIDPGSILCKRRWAVILPPPIPSLTLWGWSVMSSSYK